MPFPEFYANPTGLFHVELKRRLSLIGKVGFRTATSLRQTCFTWKKSAVSSLRLSLCFYIQRSVSRETPAMMFGRATYVKICAPLCFLSIRGVVCADNFFTSPWQQRSCFFCFIQLVFLPEKKRLSADSCFFRRCFNSVLFTAGQPLILCLPATNVIHSPFYDILPVGLSEQRFLVPYITT